MRSLIEIIYNKALTTPNIQVYEDMRNVCREIMKTDVPLAVEYLVALSNELENTILSNRWSDEEVKTLYGLHKKVLLLAAPHHFESYLLYLENQREPEKKFYPPRRKVLKQVVDALQDLADDKLDLLAISLPPGSGKTTLAIFYLTWLAGRFPDEPMLTGSHSNSFVRGVYDECLRILDPVGEYLWKEVFPGVSVSNTNAKDCRIDIGKRKRFETLEFTSIGTGNAGLYRASRLLYCDDLVSGIEVALSKDRLDKLWETYTTDLRQRKIGDHCKEIHIATRWSVHDVIGRLERDYGDSDRAKFIVIPALNDNDESNFDYAYGVGFNTKFYHEQREIMEDASWRALYMNQPIERDGVLFKEDELRRYFELPDGEPDAIISVCDTKSTGMDYCVMPIVYQYGQDYYVEDIVCDNNNPEVVETRLVMALLSHRVQMSRFESNSAGGKVAQRVQEILKSKGGFTKITTKYTTSNKETKIIVNSPFVKEHCLFKDNSIIKTDKEYRRALNYLCAYSMGGRNKHDDVPDAFAQLSEFIQSLTTGVVEVFKRPW